MCVRRDLLPVGGSHGGRGSAAGAGQGGRGPGGTGYGGGGQGGSPGEGGAGGAALGGTPNDGGDVSNDLDAGALDASDNDGGCVPVQLYRDADGDNYGNSGEPRLGCPEPGWVTTPGDCRDHEPRVHEGQTEFFGTPFVDPSVAGGLSFDFDCIGGEQADPLNAPDTGEPSCGELTDPLFCTGSGYLPLFPARGGKGIEPLCGSVTRRDCVQEGLSCHVADSQAEPFRCR